METKEGNSKMICGVKRSRVYVDRHSRSSRRCEGKSILTNIDSLPDDLLFEILLRLPAEDIHKGARLVCSKWYNMVQTRSFRYENIHRSTTGLLVHQSERGDRFFVAMREGRVEISKMSYGFKGSVSAGSGCSGLILEVDVGKKSKRVCAVNPATGRRLALPPFVYHNWSENYDCFGVAYVAASMEYKAVCTYYDNYVQRRGILILTVGVDKSWRHIDVEHLSPTSRKLLDCNPLTTEGFIHWTHKHGTRVFTLDVVTEVITETPLPQGCGEGLNCYLSTGTLITLIVKCRAFSWELWNLKPETGEWTKQPNIDLDPHEGILGCLFFRSIKLGGWLNQEVLVLHVSRTRFCVVYNVRTRELDLLDLHYACHSIICNVFKITL